MINKIMSNTISLSLIFLLCLSVTSFAQDKKVRKSLKAKVTQTIGLDTEIGFEFSRPGVKDRKIWGELVPFGLTPGNKYSDNKPFPWRAGANENTTIELSKDVLVEGKKLPAGKYGLHTIPGEKEWVIIFSKNNSLWGSYKYNEEEDALRIKVNSSSANHEEWLNFGFSDLAGSSAIAYLHWSKLKVPFKIETAN